MGDLTTTRVFTAGETNINHTKLNEIISEATLNEATVTSDKIVNGAVTGVKISAKAVSLAKIQDVATSIFLGRKTASSGVPEELSVADARSLLGLSAMAVNTATDSIAQNSFLGRKTSGSGAVEVMSQAESRTALGLGGAALLAVGTTTGTVAAGDDSRITGAVQSAGSGLVKTGTALYLKTPIVKAYNSTTQAITANTDTILSFNSEEVDTDSWFNTSTGRFQPTIACWCELSARATVAKGSLYSGRGVWIAKNGTVTEDKDDFSSDRLDDGVLGFIYTPKADAKIYFNGTTDYAQVYFRANTNCTLIAQSWGTRFEAKLVSVV